MRFGCKPSNSGTGFKCVEVETFPAEEPNTNEKFRVRKLRALSTFQQVHWVMEIVGDEMSGRKDIAQDRASKLSEATSRNGAQ